MRKKYILPLIISFLLAVIITVITSICITGITQYPIADLESGWTVKLNGSEHRDVSLYEFYKILDGKKLSRGDDITMSITLPDLGALPFPAILFKSRYTTLKCYLDDKLLYDFGQDMYEKRQFIGKMFHFISLPSKCAGKELSLKMRVGENDAFTSLQSARFGSQPDLMSSFMNTHAMVIATGIFLVVFGIVFLCITLFFVADFPDIRSLLCGSVFSINIGIWVMSYYNVLSLFIYTPFETQIEYFTLYLIVPFCYLITYFIQKIVRKRLYIAAALLTSTVTVVQFILHYGFNIHLRATLPLYHIIGLLGFLVMLYYLIRNIIRKDLTASGIIQMAGLVAFALAAVAHLVIYALDKLHIPNSYRLGILIIDSGCLCFVMCQLSNYMIYITQSYAQRKEYESLARLAYADGLTNLPNRARTDKYLEDLDKSNKDYCIVSVDLNGLKTVNDKFGHVNGDKYIKDFSKVLSTTFDGVGFLSRIGGDEFLVIIEDSQNVDIDALLGRLSSALNVMNALYTEYTRSVATGYAYRHEFTDEATSHEVYLLADQRMYEVKKRMHEELGITMRI
ncbi:MAG: GGDEF domain-containing protein [Butyrivibrio sp.]|nr:GGDEF domain-containing protein [Butyrivibrio sp.]